MSDQPQAPTAETKPLPFFLRTLGWAIPTSAPAPAPADTTPPTQTEAPQGPGFDVSHMSQRSYDLEYVGSLCPWVPVEQPPPPPHATRVRKALPCYNPHLLPELTSTQVNNLYSGILGNHHHWNGMTNFLQGQFTDGKLELWEFMEWKDMCRSIRNMGNVAVVDREKFQRAFCNSFLLWFLAVDIRYSYEVADEFAKMVKAPQLTLIFDGQLLFALYQLEWIEGSELEDLIAKLKVSRDEEDEENGVDEESS